MKRPVKIVGAVVPAFFLITGLIYYVLDRPFREARYFLLHKVDYGAVSVACMGLMARPQNESITFHDLNVHDSHLPAAIRVLKPLGLYVNAHEVVIMKTTGFDPIELILRPCIERPNAYDLVYREGSPPDPDKLLYTLTVQADAARGASGVRRTRH